MELDLKVSAFISFSLIFFLGLGSAPAAFSHPHVFITQRLGVQFDEKGLAGIKVSWEFDDMFASMVAQDHDLDRDGRLDPMEVRQVREKAFSYISEYNYFVFIRIDGKPFQVRFIKDFTAILEDNVLVYEFLIPCHVTAIKSDKKVTIATYDPSYYTAILFAQEKPVSVTCSEIFDVRTAVREDPETRIYFDMVHPWALFLEFRLKQ